MSDNRRDQLERRAVAFAIFAAGFISGVAAGIWSVFGYIGWGQ